jgi:hypothetical protein
MKQECAVCGEEYELDQLRHAHRVVNPDSMLDNQQFICCLGCLEAAPDEIILAGRLG